MTAQDALGTEKPRMTRMTPQEWDHINTVFKYVVNDEHGSLPIELVSCAVGTSHDVLIFQEKRISKDPYDDQSYTKIELLNQYVTSAQGACQRSNHRPVGWPTCWGWHAQSGCVPEAGDGMLAQPFEANQGQQHHNEFVLFDRKSVYPEWIVELEWN